MQQVQHQGSMEEESGELNQQRTMVTNPDEEYMSLRTVPMVLKNGEKSVVVNALVDDGSTQTYLNSDVAAELGLEGKICDTQVNVLNGCVESFQTMPVSVRLIGQVNMKVDAFMSHWKHEISKLGEEQTRLGTSKRNQVCCSK